MNKRFRGSMESDPHKQKTNYVVILMGCYKLEGMVIASILPLDINFYSYY